MNLGRRSVGASYKSNAAPKQQHPSTTIAAPPLPPFQPRRIGRALAYGLSMVFESEPNHPKHLNMNYNHFFTRIGSLSRVPQVFWFGRVRAAWRPGALPRGPCCRRVEKSDKRYAPGAHPMKCRISIDIGTCLHFCVPCHCTNNRGQAADTGRQNPRIHDHAAAAGAAAAPSAPPPPSAPAAGASAPAAAASAAASAASNAT